MFNLVKVNATNMRIICLLSSPNEIPEQTPRTDQSSSVSLNDGKTRETIAEVETISSWLYHCVVLGGGGASRVFHRVRPTVVVFDVNTDTMMLVSLEKPACLSSKSNHKVLK